MGIKKKKICFLVGYFPIYKGGAEYQSFLIAESLKDKYEVIFISADHIEEAVLIENGITIYTLKTLKLPLIKPIYYFQTSKLKKLLKSISPDLIYHRALTSNIGVAAKFCQENSKKLVWHIASTSELDRKCLNINPKFLFKYLEGKLIDYGIRNTNIIFTQTKEQALMLDKGYNRKSDLIIYNFHPETAAKIKKSDDSLNIVWIANLKPEKQPEIFIKLAELFINVSNIRFIMIGREANRRYQLTLDRRMQNVGNLEYKGELSIQEVNRILASSHILVNTSLYEGFSNTFIQAWKQNMPVLSLHVNPDELLTKEKVGIVAHNFENLVIQLKLLINDKKMRDEIGKNARDFSDKYFSMKNNELISTHFDDLLS